MLLSGVRRATLSTVAGLSNADPYTHLRARAVRMASEAAAAARWRVESGGASREELFLCTAAKNQVSSLKRLLERCDDDPRMRAVVEKALLLPTLSSETKKCLRDWQSGFGERSPTGC